VETRFGYPLRCPRCKGNNRSGLKLPEDCYFCGDRKTKIEVEKGEPSPMKTKTLIAERKLDTAKKRKYQAEALGISVGIYIDKLLKPGEIPDQIIIQLSPIEGGDAELPKSQE
jgi:hypothetical protein